MCRLFGIISKEKTDAKYWFFDAEIPFRDFCFKKINRGPHNSGWGIGFWDKGKWNIFKEGKTDAEIYHFDKVKEAKSNIILIHLRHASVGNEKTINAHPFEFKNFIFEHNGGISRKKCLNFLEPEYRKFVVGRTDSEIFFLLIMQFFQKLGNIISAIKETLKIIKKFPYRSLNFILSDGKRIYAYRDISEEHKDKYDYYCLHFLEKSKSVIFSSDALDKEDWQALKLGELVVVDQDLNVERMKI